MHTTLLQLITTLQGVQNTPEKLHEKQHGAHKVNKKLRIAQKAPLGLGPTTGIEKAQGVYDKWCA